MSDGILAVQDGPILRVTLDPGQWLVCVLAALPVLVASEIRVMVRRRRAPQRAA